MNFIPKYVFCFLNEIVSVLAILVGFPTFFLHAVFFVVDLQAF